MTMLASSRVNGLPIKFTPERVEQVKNLVERGKTREEIAEILEVTPNSLAVTCSRLDISLRYRARRKASKARAVKSPLPFRFALVVHYKGRQSLLKLPAQAIDYLVAQAAANDRSVGAVITNMITNSISK
jgi:hypothetical protein